MNNQPLNPLFSIITVSYNSVLTIEKTVQSVLGQTYKDFEYIIIDGGSSDGTVEIIKKNEKNISYWISEKDQGISDAFNKGIKIAKGQIVGILNSDDWYESNTLELVRNLALKNNGDIFVGALNYHNLKDKKIKTVKPDNEYSNSIMFRMPHLNHPASFFKKEVYDDVGLFNLKYKYAMDYDIFLKAYLINKKIIFTEEVLSNMLMGGAANSNRFKAYFEVLSISKNKFLGFIWFLISLIKIIILKIKNI